MGVDVTVAQGPVRQTLQNVSGMNRWMSPAERADLHAQAAEGIDEDGGRRGDVFSVR
jgi:hypothetical protein